MADLSRQSLVDALKASLNNAVEYFKAAADADFIRLLDIAALAMSEVRPRIVRDSITLVAEQTDYAAPADIMRVTRTVWGRQSRLERKPWESNYINRLPHLRLVETASGKVLELSREITASEITDIGADCGYFYEAAHSIDAVATNTTINPADRGLLLLRAQAEACAELSFRNIGKPVSMRDGVTGQARNGTPAALADRLLQSWREQAARGRL